MKEGLRCCSRCKQYKDRETAFTTGARGNKASACKDCESKRVSNYYFANQEYRNNTKRQLAERTRENRIRVYMHLLTHPCVDCGEDDVTTLDFDHRDTADKLHPVSYLVKHSSWEGVQAEIEKCDVRCASCHRRKTAKQFSTYVHLEEARRRLANLQTVKLDRNVG